MTNASRTVTTKSAVSVDRVYSSNYQKDGTLTAQLRQVVKIDSFYPAKQSTNEFTNSMFDNSDFGFKEQMFTAEENRVAFINVPVGATEATIQKMLDDIPVRNKEILALMETHKVNSHNQLAPNIKQQIMQKWNLTPEKFATLKLSDPCIYKILSNQPIVTSSQSYAMQQGLLLLDTLANRQITRYGENSPSAGQLVQDTNGKPQYRQTFFSNFEVKDIDWRTEDVNDYYASPEILMELTGEIPDEVEMDTQADSAGQTV